MCELLCVCGLAIAALVTPIVNLTCGRLWKGHPVFRCVHLAPDIARKEVMPGSIPPT